ncbi:MAG: ribulose-phosphate 3-epimerase, partial [Solirubrobacterales bacterium]
RRPPLPPATIPEDAGGNAQSPAAPAGAAGAQRLVAGSAIFGAPDPAAAYRAILQAAEAA